MRKLEFSKDWRNPVDFPTYELDEARVREDMQLLHNETKEVLNEMVDVMASETAAGNIGTTPIEGVLGENVQEVLQGLKDLLITEADVQARIGQHKDSADHDGRYFTKSEVGELLGFDSATTILYEVYTILTEDNGDDTFTYVDSTGVEQIAPLTPGGGQTFLLRNGKYIKGANHIELWVNDTLHRSSASGGLEEVEDGDAIVLDPPEGIGAEITIKYFSRPSVSGQYSVILSEQTPNVTQDEILWFKVL